MKKRISKRFLAGALAVVLSLSLGATAMALGPQEQIPTGDSALTAQGGFGDRHGQESMTPPEKREGEEAMTPPEKPEGEEAMTPPEKPEGEDG